MVKGEFMTQKWQHLAEQVSEEMDSAKLMTLVSKLCEAIDSDRQEKLHPHMIQRVIPDMQRASGEPLRESRKFESCLSNSARVGI
jgi:hypothetical protein